MGSPKNPPVITHYNFVVRIENGETGVSSDPEEPGMAQKLLAGWSVETRVAKASVKDIRALGLEVVHTPNDEFPNHCEIQSATANLEEKEVRETLAKLFKFLDHA